MRLLFSHPTAWGVCALALWCWSGPCYAAGTRGMGAMTFLAITCVLGVGAGAAIHAARGYSFARLFRCPWKVFVAGSLGINIYTILFVSAIGLAREEDLGLVVLLNYLWPIMMILLGTALGVERRGLPALLAGAAICFAGVVMVKGIGAFLRPPSSLLPHAMSFTGAFFWALYSVLLKKWSIPDEDNGSTLQWVMCAICSAALAGFKGEWRGMVMPSAATIFWALFCGIGPVGVGYYLWEIGIKRGSARLLALLAYFVPVVSALLMGLLFKESFSPGLLPGAALIAAGALLGGRSSR
ncbi:MAG: EamA family transporter [Candidatus Sumerlaeota bacterium]|nr:EamA family transporter [Candidatus Sumerlaeota bacterium]